MLDFIKEKQDVWQILQLTDKPVVLYGMGNGADQIIDLCDRMQIKVAGIFASDEFVRGQFFVVIWSRLIPQLKIGWVIF